MHTQIVISLSEMEKAPPEVKAWFSENHLPFPGGPDTKQEAIDHDTALSTVQSVFEFDMKDLLIAAKSLAQSKGKGALKSALDNMGLDRVSECPPEKVADFLTELAVHA